MIIIVLPQTLLLCDKIIEKTSINTKFYDDKEYIKVKTKTIESK